MAKEGSPSHWSHNRIFEDVGVSLENKVTPTCFWDEWEEKDQALALAHSRATKTMEAFEHHLYDKEAKRQSKRKPK